MGGAFFQKVKIFNSLPPDPLPSGEGGVEGTSYFLICWFYVFFQIIIHYSLIDIRY